MAMPPLCFSFQSGISLNKMILLARNTRLIRRVNFSSSSKQEAQEVIKGLVIPPRRVFGDAVILAVKTLFASSKESRNKFDDMVNKGVVNIDLLAKGKRDFCVKESASVKYVVPALAELSCSNHTDVPVSKKHGTNQMQNENTKTKQQKSKV
jgi:hypothetical protein